METLIDKIPHDVIGSLSPRTLEIAKSTRVPRYAFVAVQIPKVRHVRNQQPEVTTGVSILTVEDQPGQRGIIADMILKRRAKIIAYGNFPTHNDSQPDRAAKYKHHAQPGALNPWDAMAQLCEQHMGHVVEIAEENKRYKEELERQFNEKLETELAKRLEQANGNKRTKGSVGEAEGTVSKRSSKGSEGAETGATGV